MAGAGGSAQEDPGAEAPLSLVVLPRARDPRCERCCRETGFASWLRMTDTITQWSTVPFPEAASPYFMNRVC